MSYSRVIDDRDKSVLLSSASRLGAEEWLLAHKDRYKGVEDYITIEDINDDGNLEQWYTLDDLLDEIEYGDIAKRREDMQP